MARNIFSILDDLAGGISELRAALAPLTAFATQAGGRTAPARRGPGRPKGAGAAAGARRRGRPARKAAAAPAAAAGAEASAPAKRGRKAKAAGPKKAASPKRALQGKYMVALRKLSKTDQADVKRMRAEQGVEAALKLAAAKVA